MTTVETHSDAPNCPACGYDLFGIESSRCPECGLVVDRSVLAMSHLPWSHRGQIGIVAAFVRTVAIATVNPKQIAREISRPVSYADARKFRLICMVLGWIPIAVWVACFARWSNFGIDLLMENFWRSRNSALFLVLGWATICGAVWLYFVLLTALPSLYFPRLPDTRHDRAMALSYYAAAPLTWMFVPLGLVTILILQSRPFATQMSLRILLPVGMMLFLTGGVQICGPAIILANLLRSVPEVGATQRWMAFFSLPVVSVLLGAAIVAGISLGVLFVMIVAASLA